MLPALVCLRKKRLQRLPPKPLKQPPLATQLLPLKLFLLLKPQWPLKLHLQKKLLLLLYLFPTRAIQLG